MTESILDSVKKVLGLDPSYTAFDQDVIFFINSACSTLNQLGIGPVDGFRIEDSTAVWDDLLGGDLRKENVKDYVFLTTRLRFDPPATSFHLAALKEQQKELEWRINVVREDDSWVNPVPVLPPMGEFDDEVLLDGGTS